MDKDKSIQTVDDNNPISVIDRNLFNEDKSSLYEEEKKVYKTLTSIRRLYSGAVQMGLAKIASKIKDTDNPEELKMILEELREYVSTVELKDLTTACSKTLGNMHKLYSKEINLNIGGSTGGSILKSIFDD